MSRSARRTLLATLFVMLLGACNRPAPRETETAQLLGTFVTVTAFANNTETAMNRVFERVEDIQWRMTTDPDPRSEIHGINSAPAGTPRELSEDTALVLREGLRIAELSGGAFDPSVWPVVQLWGIGTPDARVPDPEALDTALDAVGWRAVDLADRVVTLDEGMGLDLGGIAKGYAAEEAKRILREEGVTSAILDFGGNIVTLGEQPTNGVWRIGVQQPDNARGSILGIVQVAEESIVTSGPYERFFIQNGTRYHHIIDPETGFPVRNGLESVTIVAVDSMLADGLSTAVFVQGLERGVAFVNSLPEVEAIFVTDNDHVVITRGLEDRFELFNPERYTLEIR